MVSTKGTCRISVSFASSRIELSHPTVDVECLAGHVSGIFPRKKYCDTANVQFWISKVTERNTIDDGLVRSRIAHILVRDRRMRRWYNRRSPGSCTFPSPVTRYAKVRE